MHPITTRLELREDSGHWTVFNPTTGLKVTASPAGERLTRTRVPELADVSVTDVCAIGCRFCYRDSRPDRAHARLEDLTFIATQLAAAGVFEVALGGGEITEHPQFREVLAAFHDAGLVTNFTSRDPHAVARHWPHIGHLVGALAVSVGGAAELHRVSSVLRAAGIPAGRVNIHLVMGTVSEGTYLSVLREAARLGHRVTLLGFKTTGRGETFTALPHDWWLSGLDVARTANLGLSIDTTLAAAFEQQILASGVPASHFHTREGRYSVFVDAVKMTLAPSSYDPPEHERPFTADWLSEYRAFP